jgi:hypothetical protein
MKAAWFLFNVVRYSVQFVLCLAVIGFILFMIYHFLWFGLDTLERYPY